MQAADVQRAVAAVRTIAAELGLTADDVVVLHDSNKLTLHLLPCDVVARVAHRGQEVALLEVELARRLAESGSPVVALEPRVEPRPYEAAGFVVTLWTHQGPGGVDGPSPAAVAAALGRLHAGMAALDVVVPHYTDRISEAQRLVASPDRTPDLAAADRELLGATLRRLRRSIGDRGAPEQLIHGEPHPGNVLGTADGVRFIDLETCCRGPVEFDVAHLPGGIGELYPSVDRELLEECRLLVLAMVTAWRWDPGDQFPNGRRAAHDLLDALREGPPWTDLDEVMRRAGDPER